MPGNRKGTIKQSILTMLKSLLCTACLFYSSGLWAAEKEAHLWNLQDVDIKTIVDQVADETGKKFILDPRVQGSITMVSSTPLQSDEVYQAFLAALQVLGFVAVPSGDFVKIVPEASGKFMETATQSTQPGDAFVVRVIPLKFVSASTLVPALRSLISPQGHLAAYAGSNVLIVADREAVVERFATIVTRVDVEDADGMESVKIEHASASDIANTLSTLSSARRPNEPTLAPLLLSGDDRSNVILISGDKKRRAQIKQLIKQLDVPIEGGGNTEVLYLKYQKAEDLVPVLSNLISSYQGLQNPKADNGLQQTNLPPLNTGASRGNNVNLNVMDAGNDSSSRYRSAGLENNMTERQALGIVMGGYGVQAEPNTNSLVVSAPPDLMRRLKNVVARLDIRRAQVLVEAIVVEMTENKLRELGVEWRGSGDLYGGLTNDAGLIDRLQGGLDAGDATVLPPGLTLGFIHDGSIQFLLRALQSDTSNNILATPSLVALDNTQANIFVGQSVPFRTGRYINEGSTDGVPFETIEQKEIGLSLDIVPQITQDQAVQLAIEQIVDNIEYFDDSGQPVTTNRSISTKVLVNDKDILVLGGLIRNETRNSEDKVPFLGDIPGLGYLFKSSTSEQIKTNLMVFLRPRIIRDQNQSIAVTQGKYDFMRDSLLSSETADPNLLPNLHKKELVRLPAPFHWEE